MLSGPSTDAAAAATHKPRTRRAGTWVRGLYFGAPSGLARLEPHEQRLGFGQQRFAVAQPTGYKDLAPVHPVDSRIDLEFLLDRHNVAVVDLEVRGPLVGPAGEHRRRQPEQAVEQHPQSPA